MDPSAAPDSAQINKRIDRILYLSSLASSQQAVDPLMDTLRAITSRWKTGQPMAESDQDGLEKLEAELKTYLVTKDPLRSFSLESLERRLNAQTTNAVTLRSFLIALLLPLAAWGGALILPNIAVEARFLIGFALFMAVLHAGIAWFYLTALKNFKTELRTVFVYFAAAVIIFSLSFSHYSVIGLFGLDERYTMLRYAGLTWLFVPPVVLMYLGMRRHSQLLQLKSVFASLKLAVGIAVAVLVALRLLPHPDVQNYTYFLIGASGAFMVPVFTLQASVLARQNQRLLTSAYARHMKLLWIYTMFMGLGGLGGAIVVFALGEVYTGQLAALIAVCGVTPQIFLLYTSYLFKKETGK